jgi:hypothetical protein
MTMEYLLKKGEVMSLDAALCPVIQVKNGVVWLTSTDDSCDHFLQRGRTYAMTDRKGLWYWSHFLIAPSSFTILIPCHGN